MKKNLKKKFKIMICMIFALSLFGCSKTSKKEVAKTFKENGFVTAISDYDYKQNQYVKLYKNYDGKSVKKIQYLFNYSYDKNQSKFHLEFWDANIGGEKERVYVDENNQEIIIPSFVKSNNKEVIDNLKKQYESSLKELLNELDISSDELKQYMVSKYQSKFKKYDSMTYQKKILFLCKDNKNSYNRWKTFFNNKTKSELNEFKKWCYEYGYSPRDVATMKDDDQQFYVRYELPSDIRLIINRFDKKIQEDSTNLELENVSKQNDDTIINYSFSGGNSGEFCSGDGIFVLNIKNHKINKLSLKFENCSDTLEENYSCYLIDAFNKLDAKESINNIYNKSISSHYVLNDYQYSKNDDEFTIAINNGN